MNATPLVSGIIIFFNAEEFFVEAIESVLAQTYDNWELLLVDDGSTDQSTEIALNYARKYPEKVRYLEHEGHSNRGMSATRNLGIKHARGEYVVFLDADDVWVTDKLEQQVAIMQEQPEAAMCYGPTLFWHAWTGDPADARRDWQTQHGPQVNALVEPPELLTLLLKDEFTVPSTCSVIVRRSVFDEVGAFEEDFRGQMEDMVFHTKVFLNKPVYISSQCWGWYRQHPNNSGQAAMASGYWLPDRPNPARCAYLRWVERYLIEQGATGEELWKVLDKELWPYRHPFRYSLKERLIKPALRRIFPESFRRRMWAYLRRRKVSTHQAT
jgi:glycosyltransferase involved in cell wall biosynthesis